MGHMTNPSLLIPEPNHPEFLFRANDYNSVWVAKSRLHRLCLIIISSETGFCCRPPLYSPDSTKYLLRHADLPVFSFGEITKEGIMAS